MKKLVQGAVGGAILVGLYIYGDSLPGSTSSSRAAGACVGDAQPWDGKNPRYQTVLDLK